MEQTRNRAWPSVAALVALFVGLGAVGTAAGAALGSVGAACAGPQTGHHRGLDDGHRLPGNR